MYMHLTTARAFGFYLDSLSNIYVAVIMLTFLLFKTGNIKYLFQAYFSKNKF